MSKINELLKNPNAVFVFDVDGVLAAYEYGNYNHNACYDREWDEYLKEHNVYASARPLKTLKDFMNQYVSEDRRFVCTTASDEDEFNLKADFVISNYHIDKSHIYMVNNQKEKLDVLKKIHQTYFPDLDDKLIVMVDDTVKVLTNIQEHSNYSTVHISSFIE